MPGPTQARIVMVTLVSIVCCVAPVAAHAQRADVIRGRVVGPDSLPLPGVILTAVSLPDSVTRKGGTSDSGTYTITFPNGTGRYVVSVTVAGFAPARRQLSRQPGDTAALVADFRLVHQAQTLAGVRSVATRARPMGGDNALNGSSIGATQTYLNTYGGLSGDFTGDLTLALAMIPGLSVIPDPSGGLPSISAFGLGADQNSFAVNGSTVGGASAPRDGFRSVVQTSTYDPSIGGFAGVRVNSQMTSGSNYTSRDLHFSLDDPTLQWNTPVASQLGRKYRQPILSGTLSGPIVWDKLFYSTAYQLQRQTSSLATLSSEDAAELVAQGISPDSVNRLVQLLNPLGIPTRTSGIPGERTSTSGSLWNRFDWRPTPPPPGNSVLTTDQYSLVAGVTFSDNAPGSAGTTSFPAFGSVSSSRSATVQTTATRYIGAVMNLTSLSFGTNISRTSPYLDLPSALILLGSTLPDGSPGSTTTLQAGGSPSPQSDSRTSALQATNITSWYTWDRVHQFKISLDATADRYANSQGPTEGTFLYNSLSDFASGQAASFTRTITGLERNGQGLRGAIGISDTYVPFINQGQSAAGQLGRHQFQLIYGLRIEGNHLGIRPAYNPLVDSLFALRTDHVPNTIAVTPMFGFNQTFGTFEFFPGAVSTRGAISGGYREYRGLLSTQSVDAFARQTGLPSGLQQLSCVGAAAPTATWSSYVESQGSIPTQCADGTTGSPLSQATPPVALYAPDYALLTRRTGTLNVRSSISTRLSGTVGATYSRGMNLPDQFDLNFNPQERFGLDAEGGRPVYVTPASISPATGAVASTESRIYPQFARVAETRSDLQSEATQLTAQLNLSPGLIFSGNSTYWNVSTSYTYSNGRDQVRGFTGSTLGDPRAVYWSPSGSMQRHAIGLTASISKPRWFDLSAQGIVRSGTPYTPRVNGDINGDGFANDRPFVFDPARTADTAVAAGMRSLLATAPPPARDCLLRQLGQIAGRNTCTGPWSSTLNLTLGLDAYRLHMGNRGNLSIAVVNSLGALDQLLHGANNLHGWGQAAFADGTLLNVRGFDPVTQQFRYSVNPLFGSSSVSQTAFRSPFRIVFDFRMYVGKDYETRTLDVLLHPAAADSTQVLNEKQIKMKLTRNLNVPYVDQLLRLKDSLKLTPAQMDTLHALSKRYLTTRDSVYTLVARYLDRLHGDYGGEEVRTYWHTQVSVVLRAAYDMYPTLRALITPEQLALLSPGYAQAWELTPEEVERRLRQSIQYVP
jgi:hypothetical protein